jgi:hypothetical protein
MIMDIEMGTEEDMTIMVMDDDMMTTDMVDMIRMVMGVADITRYIFRIF